MAQEPSSDILDTDKFFETFLKCPTTNKIYNTPIIHKNGTIYELKECPEDLINDTYKLIGLKSFIDDFLQYFPKYNSNSETKENSIGLRDFLENYLGDIIKCPLTLSTLFNGVVASDGFIYERSQITKLSKHSTLSPKTRETLKSDFIYIALIDKLIKYADDNNLDIGKDKFITGNDFKDNIHHIYDIITSGNYSEIVNFNNFQLDYIHTDNVTFLEFFLKTKSVNDNECYKAHKYILDNSINITMNINGQNILHLVCKWSIFINPSLIKYTIHIIQDKLKLQLSDFDIYDDNKKKPLDYVFERANDELIKSVLDSGINFSENILMNINMCIQKCNSKDLIISIISKLSNVNGFDDNGMSPLFTAIKYKKTEIIDYLLENNAQIELHNDNNQNAITYAIQSDDLNIIKIFINKCSDVYYLLKFTNACIKLSDNNEFTIMMINKLANINIFDESNMSPLFTAIKYKKVDIITYLLEKHSANIELCNSDDINAVSYACQTNDYNIAIIFINKCDKLEYINDHLVSLANDCIKVHNDNELIIKMLNRLPNVNLFNNNMSPLFTAIKNKKIDIIKHLLDNCNANSELCNGDNVNAISYACQTNDFNIISIFNNNKVTDDDNLIKLANSYIRLCDKDELIIDMINKLKDVNKFDNNMSPLFTAIRYKKQEIINHLVNISNINLCNGNHINAIFYVCMYGNDDTIKMMIDLCQNLEFENANGWRLIHFVCRYCSSEIIELVMNKSVQLNVPINKYDAQDSSYLPVNVLEFNKKIANDDLPYLIDYILQMMEFQNIN